MCVWSLNLNGRQNAETLAAGVNDQDSVFIDFVEMGWSTDWLEQLQPENTKVTIILPAHEKVGTSDRACRENTCTHFIH